MRPRPPLPKYAPLTRYLAAQPPGVSEVTLTLPEIEAIIGAPLPSQARTLRRKSLWLTPPAVTFVRSETIA